MVRRHKRRAEAEEDLLRYVAIPETEEEREFGEWASANAADVWADLD